jgi:hypothetical protein
LSALLAALASGLLRLLAGFLLATAALLTALTRLLFLLTGLLTTASTHKPASLAIAVNAETTAPCCLTALMVRPTAVTALDGFRGSGGKCVASANLSALAPKSSIRVD